MVAKRKYNLAIIGDPVDHSLSPPMQNAALRALRLPFRYTKIHIKADQLKRFLNQRISNLAGFNITIPHKEKIIPLLDYIVPKARIIGAVNTVVRHNGKWIGFNTDGDGYLRSLQEEGRFEPKGRHVTLLGSGGAARAIAVSLALAGAKQIIILNRSAIRAKKLAGQLAKGFKKVSFSHGSLNPSSVSRSIKKTDLLINTTSVGLLGSRFKDFPWENLPRKTLVSDIVYTPIKTPFLKEAKKRGNDILPGLGMLIHQGALSFELWTGQEADTALMRKILLKELNRRSH